MTTYRIKRKTKSFGILEGVDSLNNATGGLLSGTPIGVAAKTKIGAKNLIKTPDVS